MLVVADANGPLGLAGVMGGVSSEVREQTDAILMEAATFNGVRVRRMSMALALRSEASSRHEKTLPLALSDIGAARAAQLLVSIGAHAYAPVTEGEAPGASAPIALRARDVYRLLGLELSNERIAQHLEGLGFDVESAGDALHVRPPQWRGDVTIAADLVEEVARMEGYDEIAAIEPSVPPHEISSAQYQLEDAIASALASLGYNEIATLALQGTHVFSAVERSGLRITRTPVEIRNPMTDEQRILRWSLDPGLLDHFARLDRPYRAFELGHLFTMDEGTINETPALTFGFAAEAMNEPPWQDTHFLKLKGDCEALLHAIAGIRVDFAADQRSGWHPGKTAVALWNGREVATLGKVDPRLTRAFDVRLPTYVCNMYLDTIPEYQRPVYHPPSRFPSTYRDLAVVVDLDVTAERISQVVRSAIGSLCTNVRVFDEYRGPQAGEHRKSLAVRATMQHFDATITDEEADAAMARAIEALRDTLGGTIRQ